MKRNVQTDVPRYLKKPITVLFENKHYIVFDKPAGLLVIPSPKKEDNTLVNIVNHQYRPEKNEYHLHPCHRIDRDTSGAIIFAKGKSYQKLMMQVFQNKEIEKTYIAFVHGTLEKKSAEIKRSVRHLEQNKFNRNTTSKPAVTKYSVKNVFKHFSVVEASPLTGRTNQIRIHFSQLRHPLVGERKYAVGKDYSLKFKRPALHAARLQWIDPVDQTKITVQSELPNDMEVFLARNRN